MEDASGAADQRDSSSAVGPIVVGLVLLAVFTVVAARFAAWPMMPPRLFGVGCSALQAGLTPAAVTARWAAANNGHFGPMLPFAGACQRAGHEVLVAAPESFAGAVERAGYRHWSCPDIDPDEWAALHAKFLAAEPEKRNETMVTLGAELAARSIMPGMVAAIDEWRPDVILREIGELGSAIAGELRGVPCVQMLIGLDKFVDFTLPLAARALVAYRTSLGLAPDPGGEKLHRAPSFSLLPPSLEVPRAEAGPRVHRFRVPAAGGAPLPDWWAGDEAPLVYATFGTVAAGVPFAAAAFRTVVEALAELPVRLLTTRTGLVGDFRRGR